MDKMSLRFISSMKVGAAAAISSSEAVRMEFGGHGTGEGESQGRRIRAPLRGSEWAP